MSGSDPSAESVDGRTAAASLSFARQLASLTENAVAQSGVISETAAAQASLTADVAVMNTAPGQLVGAVGNLATQHGNLTTQVGSLATTVTVTDNTINTVAATSRNCLDAMQALPDMGQALITVVELEKKNKAALDHSNRPRLSIFTGSDRDKANWETSSRATWESWKPGCTKLLTDASLTFRLDATLRLRSFAVHHCTGLRR